MSRLSSDRAVLADTARALLLSGFSNGISDPNAATANDIDLTYTTDDIAYTPDGDLTIADGDAATVAEQLQLVEEMVDQSNKLENDMVAVRAAVAALIGDNVYDVSAPAAMTAGGLTVSFTTDDPGITADGTVTIADGDLTTANELVQYGEEFKAAFADLMGDVGAVHALVTKIIGQRGFNGVSALPALASASGFLTVTYTTDDPALSASGSIVIADGDAIQVSERNDAINEITTLCAAVRADLVATRTSLAAYLAAADIA